MLEANEQSQSTIAANPNLGSVVSQSTVVGSRGRAKRVPLSRPAINAEVKNLKMAGSSIVNPSNDSLATAAYLYKQNIPALPIAFSGPGSPPSQIRIQPHVQKQVLVQESGPTTGPHTPGPLQGVNPSFAERINESGYLIMHGEEMELDMRNERETGFARPSKYNKYYVNKYAFPKPLISMKRPVSLPR